MTKLLVIAWGNPSRGDDALGPEFLAAAENIAPPAGCTVDFVTDFQLQPEHALDIAGHDFVLFVDAAKGEGAASVAVSTSADACVAMGIQLAVPSDGSLCAALEPFSFRELHPAIDATFTSHALSPAAVLATYERVFNQAPPPACVLAIRGERFELGEPITAAGKANLAAAVAFYRTLLKKGVRPLFDARLSTLQPTCPKGR